MNRALRSVLVPAALPPLAGSVCGGPVHRYVGMADFPASAAGTGVGYNAIPSVVGDPPNTRQLRFWLTGDQHSVQMQESAIAPLTVRIENFTAPADN